MQPREKVERRKAPCFFQCFVDAEGRRVGSLKWQVPSKNWMPFWCEAHLQVNMYNTLQNTPFSDHFGNLRRQRCAGLWREAHVGVKKYKAQHAWNTFGS